MPPDPNFTVYHQRRSAHVFDTATKVERHPELARIRLMMLLCTNPRVQAAYASLQRRPCHPSEYNTKVILAAGAVRSHLSLVTGEGYEPMAHHCDGHIYLQHSIVFALKTVVHTANKTALRFYIMSLLCHELGHYYYRVFNGFNSVSDENVSFGGFFGPDVGQTLGQEGESGYWIEGQLFGGVVCVGIDDHRGQFYQQHSQDPGWDRVRTIANMPNQGSDTQNIVLSSEALKHRLETASIIPFQESELGVATVHPQSRWWASYTLGQARMRQMRLSPGDLHLVQLLGENGQSELVWERTNCCKSHQARRY